MTVYCPHCDDDQTMHRELRMETFEVRGEPIEVRSEVLVCDYCGNTVSDPDLDEQTLKQAYNEYRRRHGLLLPQEIRELRQSYGLSQRALSRLLGWGEITIQRYENGALQDQAHEAVLRRLADPYLS